MTKSAQPTKYFQHNSFIAFHGLSFQMLQKMQQTGKTQRHDILLCGHLVSVNLKTLKCSFYRQMVLNNLIKNIKQTPANEMYFFFFSVRYIVHKLFLTINI